jgi:lipopolysaccharide cholinephosphotransferase
MKLNSRRDQQKAASYISNLRELSQDEVRQLQMQLLEILKDLISVCEEHGFCYMLVYGSALGAVRHGGFIPWDDDMDVGILRKDCVPFLNMFEKKFGGKYDIVDVDFFFHIQFKELRSPKLYEVNNPFHISSEGVSLDIFPIENMPNNILKYKIYGLFIDLIFHIAHCVRRYKYSTPELTRYLSYTRYASVHYRMRLTIGFLCSFISHKKWACLYNKLVSRYHETDFLGIPVSYQLFSGSRLRKECFIPTTNGNFEGEIVSLPGNYHEHLKNAYGDYMKIPDIDERERHFLVEK